MPENLVGWTPIGVVAMAVFIVGVAALIFWLVRVVNRRRRRSQERDAVTNARVDGLDP